MRVPTEQGKMLDIDSRTHEARDAEFAVGLLALGCGVIPQPPDLDQGDRSILYALRDGALSGLWTYLESHEDTRRQFEQLAANTVEIDSRTVRDEAHAGSLGEQEREHRLAILDSIAQNSAQVAWFAERLGEDHQVIKELRRRAEQSGSKRDEVERADPNQGSHMPLAYRDDYYGLLLLLQHDSVGELTTEVLRHPDFPQDLVPLLAAYARRGMIDAAGSKGMRVQGRNNAPAAWHEFEFRRKRQSLPSPLNPEHFFLAGEIVRAFCYEEGGGRFSPDLRTISSRHESFIYSIALELHSALETFAAGPGQRLLRGSPAQCDETLVSTVRYQLSEQYYAIMLMLRLRDIPLLSQWGDVEDLPFEFVAAFQRIAAAAITKCLRMAGVQDPRRQPSMDARAALLGAGPGMLAAGINPMLANRLAGSGHPMSFGQHSEDQERFPDTAFQIISDASQLPRMHEVVGHAQAKIALEAAIRRRVLPDIAVYQGSHPLLVGPPGVGKSMLAKASLRMAAELSEQLVQSGRLEKRVTIAQIFMEDLLVKWYGSTTTFVRQFLATLREHAPIIVFLDEGEGFFRQRTDYTHEATHKILTMILTAMSGSVVEFRDITILSTSNQPELMDQAALRPERFQLIHLCFPTASELAAIAQLESRKFTSSGEPYRTPLLEQIVRRHSMDIPIASNEEVWTGADMVGLFEWVDNLRILSAGPDGSMVPITDELIQHAYSFYCSQRAEYQRILRHKAHGTDGAAACNVPESSAAQEQKTVKQAPPACAADGVPAQQHPRRERAYAARIVSGLNSQNITEYPESRQVVEAYGDAIADVLRFGGLHHWKETVYTPADETEEPYVQFHASTCDGLRIVIATAFSAPESEGADRPQSCEPAPQDCWVTYINLADQVVVEYRGDSLQRKHSAIEFFAEAKETTRRQRREALEAAREHRRLLETSFPAALVLCKNEPHRATWKADTSADLTTIHGRLGDVSITLRRHFPQASKVALFSGQAQGEAGGESFTVGFSAENARNGFEQLLALAEGNSKISPAQGAAEGSPPLDRAALAPVELRITRYGESFRMALAAFAETSFPPAPSIEAVVELEPEIAAYIGWEVRAALLELLRSQKGGCWMQPRSASLSTHRPKDNIFNHLLNEDRYAVAVLLTAEPDGIPDNITHAFPPDFFAIARDVGSAQMLQSFQQYGREITVPDQLAGSGISLETSSAEKQALALLCQTRSRALPTLAQISGLAQAAAAEIFTEVQAVMLDFFSTAPRSLLVQTHDNDQRVQLLLSPIRNAAAMFTAGRQIPGVSRDHLDFYPNALYSLLALHAQAAIVQEFIKRGIEIPKRAPVEEVLIGRLRLPERALEIGRQLRKRGGGDAASHSATDIFRSENSFGPRP